MGFTTLLLERVIKQFPVPSFHKIKGIFKTRKVNEFTFLKNSLYHSYSYSYCAPDQKKHFCALTLAPGLAFGDQGLEDQITVYKLSGVTQNLNPRNQTC